jgi:CRISPR-associated protein Cas2
MYVISYDITDTKRRNKIFKVLKNYGEHKQYSVFECDISKKRFDALYRELLDLMDDEEEGNIRIYHLCRICTDSIMVIGIGDASREDDSNIVVI